MLAPKQDNRDNEFVRIANQTIFSSIVRSVEKTIKLKSNLFSLELTAIAKFMY